MKLYKLFEQYVQHCYELYQERKWGKFALHIIFDFIGLVSVSLLLSNIILYIYYNFEMLAKIVGGIFLLIITVAYMLPKKKAELPAIPEDSPGYDPVFLNETYNLLRRNLVSICAETAEILGLRVPTTPSQIDSPVHFDIISGAAIFHFLCGKQDFASPIDSYEAIGTLQNTLERRLNNNELMGISQAAILHNGVAYPAIMIDNVLDMGRYIQIDIAITNANYLRYRKNSLYNSMNAENYTTPRDRNF